MHHSVEKAISIARKNPKILMSPSYFEKLCHPMEIETEQSGDHLIFRYKGHEARAVIITPENCSIYKCIVQEGKKGVRIYEFINALVSLLTDEEIPPSPSEKMGETAQFYCERGVAILEKELGAPLSL